MNAPEQRPTDGFYARLPEDLLADLLRETPHIAVQVTDLLMPALEQRGALREAAERAGIINEAPAVVGTTVCAVDGGFAVERTIAVDIVMAVAVGVEGFAPPSMATAWDENQYASFHRVLVHDVDNERLARACMIVHELAVLADAPHGVRIYDGSHLTPIIQLNSGFSSGSAEVTAEIYRVGLHEDLVTAFDAFVNDPKIVAMPKYDSSRELTNQLERLLDDGPHVPGDDKYVTSLILRAGEYTSPMPVPRDPWRQLHLNARAGTDDDLLELCAVLDGIIEPFRRSELYFVYWRPTDHSPTYRIEMKPPLAHDTAALHLVLATLADQVTGPFIREPYPQYLADVMAKSVGLGLSALQAAAHLSLTRTHPQLGTMLVHSYRTEGM